VALLNADDQHHSYCVAAAKTLAVPLLTIWPVITEAAYLLRVRPDAVDALIAQLIMGKLRLAELSSRDADSIRSIIARYADQDVGLTDAAILHVAQRDGIRRIFTTDRRHFSVFQTRSGKWLDILP
jgi:predicted nucleic acid-binding protein